MGKFNGCILSGLMFVWVFLPRGYSAGFGAEVLRGEQKEIRDSLSPQLQIGADSLKNAYARGMPIDSKEYFFQDTLAAFIADIWEHRDVLKDVPVWARARGEISAQGRTIRWRRLRRSKRYPQGAPFSHENFRQKLSALNLLGLLEVREAKGKLEYFVSDKLEKATRKQIEELCAIERLNESGSRIVNPRKNVPAFKRLIRAVNAVLSAANAESKREESVPIRIPEQQKLFTGTYVEQAG